MESGSGFTGVPSAEILDQMRDGVYVLDRERRITFWNKGAERISGYPREEILGKRCNEVPLKHLDETGCNLCKEYCPAAKSMDQMQPESAVVYLHARDDSIIPVETFIEPIKNADNQVTGAIETFRDVSHWHQKEKRSREKDRLVQFFAHDMKNPLAVLQMASKLMAGGHRSDMDELLAMMDKKCSFALGLIDELMKMRFDDCTETPDAGQVIFAGEWLKHVVKSHEFTAKKKKITLSLTLHDPGLQLRMDPISFQKIFNNLVCNAVHYSPAGKDVCVVLTQVGGFAQIDVKDQGQGIQEKDLETIFEPFIRSENRPTDGESSTGLGLYIVKRLVRSFRGSISVRSQVGVGSTFSVRLPRGM